MRSRQRWIAIALLPTIALVAVAVRYSLFSAGVLYGQAAAKMASLTVAGVIVLAGAFPLWVMRRTAAHDADGGEHGTAARRGTAGPREPVVAVLTVVLGLATTAYGVSELLAPNTPVAASAAACSGAPVYGARYFALTQDVGASARGGVGRDFRQTNRYGANCTLGFDGYCIGAPETDFKLNTPDQRWLIVHNRAEVIAAGVVLGQSAESKLGARPHAKCAALGGLPQPDRVDGFTYDPVAGRLTAVAPHAVAVGYVLASGTGQRGNDKALGLGRRDRAPDFPVGFKAATIAAQFRQSSGEALLGAATCLADNVPVAASLRVRKVTYQNERIVKDEQVSVPTGLGPRLAQLACDSTG
jgi:hypothetical protein